MSKNPTQLLDFLELAHWLIKCGKEKQAVETLKTVVKDLEDFIKEVKI
jgi:hypothetical protein